MHGGQAIPAFDWLHARNKSPKKRLENLTGEHEQLYDACRHDIEKPLDGYEAAGRGTPSAGANEPRASGDEGIHPQHELHQPQASAMLPTAGAEDLHHANLQKAPIGAMNSYLLIGYGKEEENVKLCAGQKPTSHGVQVTACGCSGCSFDAAASARGVAYYVRRCKA